MAEFPALPLWTDAYLGDTTHLSTIEHGAYLLLLMTAWRTRECRLPDDNRLLARYTRCTSVQWKRLRPILEPFFRIEEGFWTQPRLTDEAYAVRQLSQRQSEKGKASGRARSLKKKGRHRTPVKSGSSPVGTGTQPDANLPTPSSVSKDTGADAPSGDPIKVIFDLGVEVLTAAGSTDRQARSLVGKWRNLKGDAWALQALVDAKARSISDPVSWIEGRAKSEAVPREAALEASRATAERYRRMNIPGPGDGDGGKDAAAL